MLADMILEEEDFDPGGESWRSPQELERDLHLAAELGKTLLTRNHELEQNLQQMFSNNQEQLQEIEYLSKQVELLRHMNDQHAKVYEQLDTAARALEQGNRTLVQDNRLSRQKINSLTETIDGLQTLMEDLQTQVDQLTAAQAERSRRESEQRRHLGAQSVSCIKELYDRPLAYDSLRMDGLASPQGWFQQRDRYPEPEEENVVLHRSVQTLQAQIVSEQSRRAAAEREVESTARENVALEQQLSVLSGRRARQKELESEVEQLRLLWRAERAKSIRIPDQLLLPDTVFFASEEKPGQSQQSDAEEKDENNEEQRRFRRHRCNSDGVVKVPRGHAQLCIRQSEAVKQRGISLLNEVDAQYSALKVKYEDLLRRCHHPPKDALSHKAVQTSQSPYASVRTLRCSSAPTLSDLMLTLEDSQPEYKALFTEIFSCIQKSREDLVENRHSDGERVCDVGASASIFTSP